MEKQLTIWDFPYDDHKFPYRWTLKDAVFTKDKGKVFSCFACGGGSTMGYKLAGFDVLGCNEIDPKMMACYIENHKPKYSFLEPIQDFKLRKDLPDELYNLDILDGSPPCSSFSMAGNREKDWGKDKVFREGQKKQVLDTLFFDFIDLAKELQPKIVIAENVKGLILGDAMKYVAKIYREFEKAGYVVQHFLLNASKMGVPQRRERVFFIALRKDLVAPFIHKVNTFPIVPKLEMVFNEKEISYKEFALMNGPSITDHCMKAWEFRKPNHAGISDSKPFAGMKATNFNSSYIKAEKPLNTLTGKGRHTFILYDKPLYPSDEELILAGSFPTDYNFKDSSAGYLTGMSVPPVMTAQIATRIYKQWLSKL